MRVAHVTGSLSRLGGGVSASIYDLAESQVSKDMSVVIYGIRDKYTEEDVRRDLEVEHYSATGAFGYSPDLASALRAGMADVDVVHIHGLWSFPGIAACRAARDTLTPYVVSPHGMLDLWARTNSKIKKAIAGLLYERKNLQGAACLHALCEPERESIRDYGLSNPVCVIPNGVHIREKSNLESIVWRENVDAGENVLLFLGRIHPKKGVETLIKAWCELSASGGVKNWKLVIAGWGEKKHVDKYERLVKLLDDKHTVCLMGPLYGEDKEAALSNAKAFVLPSLSEGLPVAVLEAWSYGLPVIMTEACNLPCGFDEASAIETGYDVDSLKKSMMQIFEMSDDQLARMGDLGLELVKSRFTWAEIATRLKNVYNWLHGSGEVLDYLKME